MLPRVSTFLIVRLNCPASIKRWTGLAYVCMKVLKQRSEAFLGSLKESAQAIDVLQTHQVV